MTYDSHKHNRHSIRLKGYDYTAVGYYFITICVDGRQCSLGRIDNGRMVLSDFGRIAATEWTGLADRYPYVQVDEYVIMPNHIHGILVIADDDEAHPDEGKGTSRDRPDHVTGREGVSRSASTEPLSSKRKPLGQLIGVFKTTSTKQINRLRHIGGQRFWQRNYYEHIIRNERALHAIREYMRHNPANWADDQLHTHAPPNKFNQEKQGRFATGST